MNEIEQELPSVRYAEGFSYLYDLLSHLTSSKLLFVHKINVLIQLSREVKKSQFTKAEVEAMLPQYSPKTLDSIINSLIDGGWLIREEGKLAYQFSKPGLLFIRFLPFLYRGNEMDSMAFQRALKEIFNAAEQMNLDILSLEFLRDQALHAVQRDIAEIESALITRNKERIYETSMRFDQFLRNIKELIQRFKEFNQAKKNMKLPITDTDKESIDILTRLETKIMELLDKKKERYIEAAALGKGFFTKADIDRFLTSKDFDFFAYMTDEIAFLPSNAKWVDEDDIIVALNIFLERRKRIKNRTISSRVYGKQEEFQNRMKTYYQKVEEALIEVFKDKGEVDLDVFLLPLTDKIDIFMYLATASFLDRKRLNKRMTLHLQAKKEVKQLENHPLKILTDAKLIRRDI